MALENVHKSDDSWRNVQENAALGKKRAAFNRYETAEQIRAKKARMQNLQNARSVKNNAGEWDDDIPLAGEGFTVNRA